MNIDNKILWLFPLSIRHITDQIFFI